MCKFLIKRSEAYLKDVQVNVMGCLTLQKRQDSLSDFIMSDFLNFRPFCVYWSERQAQPKQMSLGFPRGAVRSALIAYEENSNGRQFCFNSLNHEAVIGGVKIDVEISRYDAVLWKGDLECHPNFAGQKQQITSRQNLSS